MQMLPLACGAAGTLTWDRTEGQTNFAEKCSPSLTQGERIQSEDRNVNRKSEQPAIEMGVTVYIHARQGSIINDPCLAG